MNKGISSPYLLVIGIICFIAAVVEFIYGDKLYKLYVKDNIYNITVDKILKEYNKLIVNGEVSIDENKFTNKIYPETFIELVDASERLQSPILFYEVVPNEKCFFIIIKDNDLYKFRISKNCLDLSEEESVNEFIRITIITDFICMGISGLCSITKMGAAFAKGGTESALRFTDAPIIREVIQHLPTFVIERTGCLSLCFL